MVRYAIERNWNNFTLNRKCGACSACCVYLGVEELQKPSNVKCKFLTGSGHCKCGIYPDRPKACVDYICAWRGGWGPDWLQPTKSGLLVTLYPAEDNSDQYTATINVFDASKTPEYRIRKIVAELILTNCQEVRLIDIEQQTGLLFRNGLVYNCRLLPPEGWETLMFEADEVPIGRFRAE